MTSIALFGAVRVTNISRRLRRKEGLLAGRMHALLIGAEAAEDQDEVESAERKSARAEAKTTKVEGLTIWAVHATLAVTSCGVVLLGLHLVRSGALQPADMFTVLFYLLMVHNPTVRLSRQTVRLGRVLASAERLAKVLKRDEAEAGGSSRSQAPRWPSWEAAVSMSAKPVLTSVPPVGERKPPPFGGKHRFLFESEHWRVFLYETRSTSAAPSCT